VDTVDVALTAFKPLIGILGDVDGRDRSRRAPPFPIGQGQRIRKAAFEGCLSAPATGALSSESNRALDAVTAAHYPALYASY
jgi:hypothetical protein